MRLVVCPRFVTGFMLMLLCACTEQKTVSPQEPTEQLSESNQSEQPASTPLATPAPAPSSSLLPETEPTEFNESLTPSKINWFEGQVEDAFKQAEETNTPLFLYWGAVWCPPCEEIKQTVFKSIDFIAQSRLFIPVFLNGDSQRAQTWGEHFAVRGYPTMIVFNPDGEEITRIPGGIDISQYNRVLARSLDSMRPTAELLALALTRGTTRLIAQDYSQIAFYSWWQKNLPDNVSVSAATLAKLALQAEEKGNQTAADRLQLQSLITGYENEQSLSQDASNFLRDYLSALLSDRNRVLANLDLLMFWSEEILSVIAEPGVERSQMVMRWVAGMKSVRYDSRLSHAEQAGTWYPELYFYWMDNPEAETLEPADLSDLLTHIDRLDKVTHDTARQTYINRAYQVLLAARLPSRAKYMLESEIQKSHQPYYFMSSLAQLERDQGNYPAAVAWLQRAYQTSTGQATRFQWGVEYVIGVMAMQPEQVADIEAGLDSLLVNLQQPQDVFAGRNLKRLHALLDAIDQWPSREASASVITLYDSLRNACKASRRDSIARQNCRSIKAITDS